MLADSSRALLTDHERTEHVETSSGELSVTHNNVVVTHLSFMVGLSNLRPCCFSASEPTPVDPILGLEYWRARLMTGRKRSPQDVDSSVPKHDALITIVRMYERLRGAELVT